MGDYLKLKVISLGSGIADYTINLSRVPYRSLIVPRGKLSTFITCCYWTTKV